MIVDLHVTWWMSGISGMGFKLASQGHASLIQLKERKW